MQNVIRFDFNGSSSEFKRTPQGFLRVSARLSKAGIFSYEDRREYRPESEVFREDSLSSLKGAPVTDLHPSEKGADSFLNSSNTKEYIIGITESVERDGPYLKGSLIIFHEDAIKAIEEGSRKEISLGYKCELEPIPGSVNGESYDAIQKNIVVNHVAIGPKGWGRAGPDCAIKTDSKENKMSETIRLDGVDVALTSDNILKIFNEKKEELENIKGRLDAIKTQLDAEQKKREALEDPKAIEEKLQARIRLDSIKKLYPDLDLSNKEQSYIDGMYEALKLEERNDSLSSTRLNIEQSHKKPIPAYEQWLSSSNEQWRKPLAGHL